MTVAVAEPGKLDIGRVIGETFAVVGRNFVTFFVLSLLLSGVPAAIVAFIQAGFTQDAAAGNFDFSAGRFTGMAIGGLASVITTSILQGTIIYATVQDMNGQRPSIGDSLATGLRAFLPLIGLSILLGLAIVFGFVFLVVPGVMMLCAWCVAVPALVADRTGIMGAFSRSAQLTRGNRWRIFGLLILVWIILLVIGAVLGGVAGVAAVGTSGMDPTALARNPVLIISNVLSSTLSALLGSAGAAVLYVELRKLREGLGPQWLADIFS